MKTIRAMQGQRLLIGVLIVGLLLAPAVGLPGTLRVSQAQGPVPEGDTPAGDQAGAAVGGRIPIQGRLTDASGNPLTGTYNIRFRLYDAAASGSVVCEDTNSVAVTNGLFNSEIVGTCGSADINGQQLYLGIKVGTDDEMTDRQAIYPVPYAWSLRPGAQISGTVSGSPVLNVRNSGSTEGSSGVRGWATAASGLTYGLRGISDSPDGRGVYGSAGSGVGVYGLSSTGTGVYGNNSADGFGVYGTSGAGNTSGGVRGVANNANAAGVRADNYAGGTAIYGSANAPAPVDHSVPTLYLVQLDAGGDFVVGADNRWGGNRKWRVDRTGKGFFNGGTQLGGADFAEQIPVAGQQTDYEPGDVLVISAEADRMVALSTEPYATAVIGVYSTQPAVLAGAPDTAEPLGGIPVTILGIVPCKVSAENGPVQRGDLLVSSATPGYAMRAGANPPPGTVLGKALQPLPIGQRTGLILVLVTLQ
ncbi:MAG: hypothetical protein KKA73_30915 [Chloroflexi bacterium]|nr:hypothetical protein [Chloroflexota bacterium]MBU1752114.1 hypothetical protein [Chloroflexota bacterium]